MGDDSGWAVRTCISSDGFQCGPQQLLAWLFVFSGGSLEDLGGFFDCHHLHLYRHTLRERILWLLVVFLLCLLVYWLLGCFWCDWAVLIAEQFFDGYFCVFVRQSAFDVWWFWLLVSFFDDVDIVVEMVEEFILIDTLYGFERRGIGLCSILLLLLRLATVLDGCELVVIVLCLWADGEHQLIIIWNNKLPSWYSWFMSSVSVGDGCI